MKEVLKSFFCSNGSKTSFRPSFFWVCMIMLPLIAAIWIEVVKADGKRIPLIAALMIYALGLLGVYNWRKIKDKVSEFAGKIRGRTIDGTPKG